MYKYTLVKEVESKVEKFQEKRINAFDEIEKRLEAIKKPLRLAKINTIKSLKWHLLVLWYLNPDMDKEKFINLTEVITYKENGFVTFNVAPNIKKSIINFGVKCSPPP